MGGWGSQGVTSAATKAARVAAASRGARRGLPEAHEAGPASSSSQRPGSTSPGRRWREEGPRPHRSDTSATLARGFRSMATRRLPGSPALRHPGLPAWARSGPGRRRPLRRRLVASHRRSARPARRGRAGPDPRTGAAARRPRRSAPSRASQPLPGNARPRVERRAPPPGRPGACLRAARRRARRDRVPALLQDPPLRRAPGTAPPRTRTRTPGALEKRSQTR